ncbi:MAG: ABC transporter permease, partial [Verrucomicrobiales bacterium]|nr:ABC transporter permease [Verrucomicrobiales bacterium]
MTIRTLIGRSLRFHWRTHLGVMLGAAIGSAALLGALVVGDSVRGTLRRIALDRISGVQLALRTGDRFFETALWDRMLAAASNAAGAHPPSETASALDARSGCALLEFRASVSLPDGRARANAVRVFGTQRAFWSELDALRPGTVLVNRALATRLGLTNGDPLIIRLPRPSALSPEAALTPRDQADAVLRLTVAGILPDRPGNFALDSGVAPPLNAFVALEDVQEAAGLPGRANLLVVEGVFRHGSPQSGNRLRDPLDEFKNPGRWSSGRRAGTGWPASDDAALNHLQARLREQWRLADAECELRELPEESHLLELRTRRVFLDPPLVRAALKAQPDAQPLLTYLANLLCAGTNATPYSMVTAAGPPWTPPDLREDEILVTEWLAEDLRVKPGDKIALVYFDPESGVRLVERTNTFRVRAIVPMTRPWADRTLMPDFPGIEKAESTRDWDAGFPLTYKIRQKDEDYWKQWRGTPKAFISLSAGQKLWANRFGNATAVRFGLSSDGSDLSDFSARALSSKIALERRILANLEPEEVGLRFEAVRERALQAARESQDFGGLFLGFSFFLIGAALVLMALLFRFGLEQRAPEIGTLLALGFTPGQVRGLLLGEGAVLALLG